MGEKPCRSAILTKLLCNFIEIIPTHGCAPENSQRTHKTTSSRRLFLYVKRVLKDLNYKKFLFTAVKKHLFTHKIRLLLRFFHSSYFTSMFYVSIFFANQDNFSQAVYLLAIYLNMINLELKDSVKQNQSLIMFF